MPIRLRQYWTSCSTYVGYFVSLLQQEHVCRRETSVMSGDDFTRLQLSLYSQGIFWWIALEPVSSDALHENAVESLRRRPRMTKCDSRRDRRRTVAPSGKTLYLQTNQLQYNNAWCETVLSGQLFEVHQDEGQVSKQSPALDPPVSSFPRRTRWGTGARRAVLLASSTPEVLSASGAFVYFRCAPRRAR